MYFIGNGLVDVFLVWEKIDENDVSSMPVNLIKKKKKKYILFEGGNEEPKES